MPSKRTSEAAFETAIESVLLANGYTRVAGKAFDRERALFPDEALAFIRATQGKVWDKLEALHGEHTGARVLEALCKWLDTHGALATLRHGFKCFGKTLRIAFFRPAHGLNPELEARYRANRLGLTRQLHFSPKSEQSLDVVLSVNGIPLVTLELKNPLSGQTAANAIHQYRHDRDPREPIFVFSKRALVHFAVDTEEAHMATRLAGSSTYFLPFNRGADGGAGNPPHPEGRNYKTAYVWEEVLQRDSLLDLLARFLHLDVEEKTTDDGKKLRKESLIFPRYHQLQAVRQMVAAAASEGVGHNYLVEHSAGSGKSNTIAWLAHRLSSLHDERDQRLFDSVVVITDRVVLDRQLQNTIYQFDHRQGVVQKIDEDSRQLAEALEAGVPIIITTLQKFPFVSGQLMKLAEERGEGSKSHLPTRRYAVIIDEAHSSQSGETATELKGVLGGAELRRKAQEMAEDEGELELERLFRSMAKRGQQPNMSFFAFTATPKHKTLAIFGRKGEPFHRYTMRQAIEEGFIEDVLKSYVTYKTYYKLIKKAEDDPNVERKKAAKALARFMRLHPHNIGQKTEVMVEHFQHFTRHKIGGHAKAMVVTGSRLEAVRYKQEFDRYIQEKGYPIKSLVAFSGSVEDDRIAEKTYTEVEMNGGLKEKALPETFAKPDFRVLLVAEKYQTGFDQPLLHTMYVDKMLSGIKAVQTLSRLNRAHPKKHDVFVLDFQNDTKAIEEAFAAYYRTTILSKETDPNKLHTLKSELDGYQVYAPKQVDELVALYLSGAERGKLDPVLDACVAAYRDELDEDGQVDFKGKAKAFCRTYDFLAAILPYGVQEWEKLSIFLNFLISRLPAPKEEDLSKGILEAIDMDSYRAEKKATMAIALPDANAEIEPVPTGNGGHKPEPEMDRLSNIIKAFNDQFGGLFNDPKAVEKRIIEVIPPKVLADAKYQNARKNSDRQNARIEHDQALKRVITAMFKDDAQLFKQFQDNESFRRWLTDTIFGLTYEE